MQESSWRGGPDADVAGSVNSEERIRPRSRPITNLEQVVVVRSRVFGDRQPEVGVGVGGSVEDNGRVGFGDSEVAVHGGGSGNRDGARPQEGEARISGEIAKGDVFCPVRSGDVNVVVRTLLEVKGVGNGVRDIGGDAGGGGSVQGNPVIAGNGQESIGSTPGGGRGGSESQCSGRGGPGTAKVPGQSQGPGRSGCHSQCSSGRAGDAGGSVRVHKGQVAHRGDLEGISAISDLQLGGRGGVSDADVAGVHYQSIVSRGGSTGGKVAGNVGATGNIGIGDGRIEAVSGMSQVGVCATASQIQKFGSS